MYFGIKDIINGTINGIPSEEIVEAVDKMIKENSNDDTK